MEENKDRRTLDRFEITSAEVFYRSKEEQRFFNPFNGPMTLVNLSKGGACFACNELIGEGNLVELTIRIPGEKKIRIRGTIMWSVGNEESSYTCGMQFLAFGPAKKYNPTKLLGRLRRLTDNVH